MANVIVCIKCNNNYDTEDVKRDFRYRSSGKPFDRCVYCRGLRTPMHMTCDICNKLRIHCEYIRLIKIGNYHSTCSDCLGETECQRLARLNIDTIDNYKPRSVKQ